METFVAANLIKDGIGSALPAQWADLGAGTGVFTEALAQHLQGKGSMIYAVDQDLSALEKIRQHVGEVTIMKLHLNFMADELPLTHLDGILMANSLHYVEDKIALLTKLKAMLKPQGRLVIVEYDTSTANPWVPYPINYLLLNKVVKDTGFRQVVRLGEVPSRYGHIMYAALVQ